MLVSEVVVVEIVTCGEVFQEIDLYIRVDEELRLFVVAFRVVDEVYGVAGGWVFFRCFGYTVFAVIAGINTRYAFLHLQAVQVVYVVTFLVGMVTPCTHTYSEEVGDARFDVAAHIIFLHALASHQSRFV